MAYLLGTPAAPHRRTEQQGGGPTWGEAPAAVRSEHGAGFRVLLPADGRLDGYLDGVVLAPDAAHHRRPESHVVDVLRVRVAADRHGLPGRRAKVPCRAGRPGPKPGRRRSGRHGRGDLVFPGPERPRVGGRKRDLDERGQRQQARRNQSKPESDLDVSGPGIEWVAAEVRLLGRKRQDQAHEGHGPAQVPFRSQCRGRRLLRRPIGGIPTLELDAPAGSLLGGCLEVSIAAIATARGVRIGANRPRRRLIGGCGVRADGLCRRPTDGE
jgi:hypothetical protein